MKCLPEKAAGEDGEGKDLNSLGRCGCVTELRKQHGANYSMYFISVYLDLLSYECSVEHFPPAQGLSKETYI